MEQNAGEKIQKQRVAINSHVQVFQLQLYSARAQDGPQEMERI